MHFLQSFVHIVTLAVFLVTVLVSPVLSTRAYATETAIAESEKKIEDELRKSPERLYEYKKQTVASINQTLREMRAFKDKPTEFKRYLLDNLSVLRNRSQEIDYNSPLVQNFDKIREEIEKGAVSFASAYARLIELREKIESLDMDAFLRVLAKIGAVFLVVTGIGTMVIGGMLFGFAGFTGWGLIGVLILFSGVGTLCLGVKLWDYIDEK